jgi:glutathione synthase/RimK-type ligase-like ATP-grasp enzyme
MVKRELDALGTSYLMFNQRQVDQCDLAIEMNGKGVGGCFTLAAQNFPLDTIQGIYARLMDDTQLPELQNDPENSARRRHSRSLHGLLIRWLEIAPGRIINRPSAMASNSSKPYQAQLIQGYGFKVPETLITNDPQAVRFFRERHGRIVYKSISGVRSIVMELEDYDLERLEQIRACPTQFQQYVEGCDVRVHTIGKQVFATQACSTTVDYRYASRQGGNTEMEAIELPDQWAQRCVNLAHGLGLAFAGIDLKITPDNQIFCFEVNPCPVFSYYEANTGQPIARAVAQFLSGVV